MIAGISDRPGGDRAPATGALGRLGEEFRDKEPEMSDLSTIVKAYDVRGTVPDQVNADVARAIGAAFVQALRAGGENADAIVIAHDMRDTSPGLATAFGEGARAEGTDVIEAGLGSTDLLYFASGYLDRP